jgi:hypothetical protein
VELSTDNAPPGTAAALIMMMTDPPLGVALAMEVGGAGHRPTTLKHAEQAPEDSSLVPRGITPCCLYRGEGAVEVGICSCRLED